jgi:hypothetical protein
MLRKRNGNIYFYASIREDGKVRTLYAGSGEIALEIALEQQSEREERRKKRQRAAAKRRRAQKRLDDLETAIAGFSAIVDQAVECHGYHRQSRHRWRRRRCAMKTIADEHIRAREALPAKAQEAEHTELQSLFDRGLKNELSTAEQERLSVLFARNGMPSRLGGPGELLRAELSRFFLAGKKDQTSRAIFNSWFDCMYDEVAGPNPTPLEKLLAFRVVIAWSVVSILDRHTLVSADNALSSRADRAHRRLMISVRTLAQIRRLPAPTLALVSVNMSAADAVGSRFRPPPAIEAEGATTPGDSRT